jgi:hypothetical protein
LDPLTVQRWVSNGAEWALMSLPLAGYFLIYGLFINRRRHPVVMRGDRNVLWLMLAASGFFLLGPASWLAHPFKNWGIKFYWIAYGIYLVVLVMAAIAWMRRERRNLVVSNLSPALMAELLPKVLADLNVAYVVTPGRISFAEGKLVLDLETSFLFHSVCLQWHGEESELQAKITGSLIQALATVETPEHPGGMMLTFCGILLFSFVLFASVLYGVMMVTLHFM